MFGHFTTLCMKGSISTVFKCFDMIFSRKKVKEKIKKSKSTIKKKNLQ